MVGFLYKPETEDNDELLDMGVLPINLLISKHRSGPTGEVHLTFFQGFTRFESAARISMAPENIPIVEQVKTQFTDEAGVLNAWNTLDPAITAHAQPSGLSKTGTLFVAVDSQVRLDEIVRYRRPEILKSLKAAGLTMVDKISFRLAK